MGRQAFVSRRKWQSRQRPLLRSLSDAMIFAALLAMVWLGLRQAGWLAAESGSFIAIDGDSLRKDGQEFRLAAIDAPELHQSCEDARGATYPCGRDAQDALRALITGDTLECRVIDTDRYGRAVSECMKGSLDINAEMVRLGWAIAYRRHGTAYVDAEDEARTARRGIWQGRFENPENWRARHRDGLVRGGLGGDDDLPD
jgi:endonuclease YncB( thermonuclease family)